MEKWLTQPATRGIIKSFCLGAVSALLNEFGDQRRPAGLMGRAQAFSGFSVEVFVEGHQISEIRVGLQFLVVAQHGARSRFVAREKRDEPARKQSRHLPQRHHLARTTWSFDLESVAVEIIEFLQRLDQ